VPNINWWWFSDKNSKQLLSMQLNAPSNKWMKIESLLESLNGGDKEFLQRERADFLMWWSHLLIPFDGEAEQLLFHDEWWWWIQTGSMSVFLTVLSGLNWIPNWHENITSHCYLYNLFELWQEDKILWLYSVRKKPLSHFLKDKHLTFDKVHHHETSWW